MYYDGQCGSCGLFEDEHGGLYDCNNPDYIKGFCNYYRAYYYATERACSHYERRSSSSGGCFITTIVCNQLGYSDDCETLEVLRYFRNQVLQKNSRYAALLYEYDIVGPRIAEKIEKDSYDFSYLLYKNDIEPIVSCIKKNEYLKAIYCYIKMTQYLLDYYHIPSNYSVSSSYDFTQGGHGYIRKR